MSTTSSLRRLYPGTSLEEAFQWPFEPIDSLDSSFSVQEYLQQLIRQDCSDVQRIVELPESVEKDIWQYEHLRQVCLELSLLVVALESECTKQCPAIDYIIHTLDGATILLNNNKYFPSRISIPEPSLKHFQSVARRLYRIFAHAYFHHREVYEYFENDTHLYARFLLLSRTYGLIPSNLINIPDAEDGNNANNDDEDENDYNRG